MRRVTFAVCALLLIAAVAPAFAQMQNSHDHNAPPKVIQIAVEQVKPGRGFAHEKLESAWARAAAQAKYPVGYLGMTSLTGSDEAWFISPYDSFAAWEKANKQVEASTAAMNVNMTYGPQDSENISGYTSMVAVFRPDLSYRPNVKIAEMRYFGVNRIRVRPGHERQFEEARKAQVAAHEKGNVDESIAVFEVAGGAPAGTYLLISPIKSLESLDTYDERHKPYEAALGEDGQKKLREQFADAELGSEERIFAFNPKMSYVDDAFVGSETAFWRPKVSAGGVQNAGLKKADPAAKKEAPKK
jgi:hypothetical protein